MTSRYRPLLSASERYSRNSNTSSMCGSHGFHLPGRTAPRHCYNPVRDRRGTRHPFPRGTPLRPRCCTPASLLLLRTLPLRRYCSPLRPSLYCSLRSLCCSRRPSAGSRSHRRRYRCCGGTGTSCMSHVSPCPRRRHRRRRHRGCRKGCNAGPVERGT